MKRYLKLLVTGVIVIIIFMVSIKLDGYSSGDYLYFGKDASLKIKAKDNFSPKASKRMLLDTNNRLECIVGIDKMAVCFYNNNNRTMKSQLFYDRYKRNGKIKLETSKEKNEKGNYIVLDTIKYTLPEVIKVITPDEKEKDLKVKIEKVDYKVLEG